MTRPLLLLALLARTASADLMNDAAIHAHVDEVIARHELPAPASRLSLSLTALVPVLGSYRLDGVVFGGVRPSAIAFDWLLGGVAPATLAAVALAEDGSTRRTLLWTALGLYAATRIGVLVVGNLHISEYRRYVHVRVSPAGITASW